MPACYEEKVYSTNSPIRSLVWAGDELVDWLSCRRFFPDGSISETKWSFGYPFDAAITEPSGEFCVVYTRLNTKGLVLREGNIVREINRSYYHADAYEYPVALWRRDDRVLLIHCPNDYNKLEIEDAITGEHLSRREDRSPDFFHSRLSVSPDGRYLLSAGWHWHPWDAVHYYHLEGALNDPSCLDHPLPAPCYPDGSTYAEESSACWAGKTTVILGSSTEMEKDLDQGPTGAFLRPRGIAAYDLEKRVFFASCKIAEVAGTMMPVGSTHVMAFFGHPRLIRMSDGHEEFSLPGISSGQQCGSIIWHLPSLPPLAIDPMKNRFAIAQGNKVHVFTVIL